MRHSLLIITIAASACGDLESDGPPLFPLEVGNQWVYDEIAAADGTLLGTVTKTITNRESYQERSTLVLTTEQTNSPITKVSNWLVEGERVSRLIQRRLDADSLELVNYRTYEPGFLRIAGNLTGAGEQLQEAHVRSEYLADGALSAQKSKTYTWVVEQVDEEVTVPAGTFSCVRIGRVDSDAGTKTYWYAAGVGKIKEADADEEEHLRDYVVSE